MLNKKIPKRFKGLVPFKWNYLFQTKQTCKISTLNIIYLILSFFLKKNSIKYRKYSNEDLITWFWQFLYSSDDGNWNSLQDQNYSNDVYFFFAFPDTQTKKNMEQKFKLWQ